LGTQVDNYFGTKQEPSHHSDVDNEQDQKLPGSPQGSSGHGDAGTQEDSSSCMNQEPSNDDNKEPNTKTSASAPSDEQSSSTTQIQGHICTPVGSTKEECK
jgi:hypothetical protein